MVRIFKDVQIGKNLTIEDYVIVGQPPGNESNDVFSTTLGDDALLRSHTVIYAGNKIGDHFQTGHGTLLRECNELGNNVTVGSHSIVEGYCKIFDFATIHSNCYIGEKTVIGENAWLGPGCMTLLTMHPRCKYKNECDSGPVIKKDAVIGAGAILMPGVTIGEGSMIGAGAIVNADIFSHSVAIGVPAKKIKSVEDLRCRIGKGYER